MSAFDDALSFVLAKEGGYCNVEGDHGGCTNMGITQAVYTKWLADQMKPFADVKYISMDEVKRIYTDLYWKKAHCDQLPDDLNVVMFDTAVNMGVGRAIKFLQTGLAVGSDGVWGILTVNALHEEIMAGQIPSLIQHYIALRREFYQHIVERDPTQAKFLKGWNNRIDSLQEAIA